MRSLSSNICSYFNTKYLSSLYTSPNTVHLRIEYNIMFGSIKVEYGCLFFLWYKPEQYLSNPWQEIPIHHTFQHSCDNGEMELCMSISRKGNLLCIQSMHISAKEIHSLEIQFNFLHPFSVLLECNKKIKLPFVSWVIFSPIFLSVFHGELYQFFWHSNSNKILFKYWKGYLYFFEPHVCLSSICHFEDLSSNQNHLLSCNY